MWDILTFNTFITPDVLIFFYYIGVIFIPFLLWVFRDYFDKYISAKNRVKIVFILLALFITSELFLRMIFEMIIGYFDMHNYLQILNHIIID